MCVYCWGVVFLVVVVVGVEKFKFFCVMLMLLIGCVIIVYVVGDYCVEYDRFGGFRVVVVSGFVCVEDIFVMKLVCLKF